MTDFASPKTIRTVILNTKSLTLSINQLPTPTAPVNEHLIRVQASAITNGELGWAPFVNWPEHHVPTYDMTGTILSDVPDSKFNIGDEIYGHTDAFNEGAAREIAHIVHTAIARKPKNLSWEEAASVPTSGLTAWQGLFTQGRLAEPDLTGAALPNKGKRVLITAASGGVGVYAVQLAKLAGATVVGTCGPNNIEFVKSLGASEVIDYRSTSIESWVGGDESKRFDVILHCAADHSGKTLIDCAAAIKENGLLVSIAPGFKDPDNLPKGAKAWFFILSSLGDQLEKMTALFEAGKLKAAVDSVWKLEQYQEAFDRAGAGHAKGRVVLSTIL